jgi:hypothetical protein
MAIGWKMDPTVLGIALLTIADSSSFVSANNPSGFTFRRFSGQNDKIRSETWEDAHLGLGKAGLETLAVGFGGALITESWWPLILPMAYLMLQVGWTRWNLNNPHTESTSISSQRTGTY